MSGKKIDFAALKNATTKVTLGFKCNPSLKLELIQEADAFGCSLSEYVELVVANRKLFAPQ